MTVIIDYGMGNVASIRNMLRRIGHTATLSCDPADLAAASRLILPGVGSFDQGMKEIHQRGLYEVLNQKVVDQHTPVLGICLGMQLLSRSSEEGTLPGLGWLPARTVRFNLTETAPGLKVPHMGWNTTAAHRADTLFQGLDQPHTRFYFVHAYHVVCDEDTDVLATAEHGITFTASVQRGHIMGTQFHPEKSHRFGMQLLENFITTC